MYVILRKNRIEWIEWFVTLELRLEEEIAIVK